jgi:hypothetical protein
MVKLLKNREEYFAYPALNYSTLKGMAEDPENLLPSESKSSDAMTFGSAVDTLIFDGREQFDKEFCIFDTPKPTASTLELAEKYIEIHKTTGCSLRDETLAIGLIKDLGLWSTVKKEETLLKKLTDEFWNYIYAVVQAGDRAVLDSEMGEKVSLMVDTLKTHFLTKDYYQQDDGTYDVNKRQIIYQLPIVFNIGSAEMKIMLDAVVVDHFTKSIIPVDTKTMEKSAKSFGGQAVTYRYDIQAELYHKGICEWAAQNYPGYAVQEFMFIVISKSRIDKPYVYRMVAETFRQKINKHRVIELKGLQQLMRDFEWHTVNQKYEYPMEMYQNGYITL